MPDQGNGAAGGADTSVLDAAKAVYDELRGGRSYEDLRANEKSDLFASARYAYYTAEFILGAPFSDGDLTGSLIAIQSDAYYSYLYLTRVLQVYTNDADELMYKNADNVSLPLSDYVVIRNCHDTIAGHAMYSYLYARDVGMDAFAEAEEAISEDASASYGYAKEVIKGPFLKGELAISEHAYLSYLYSRNVLYGRFLLGEKVIRDEDHEIYELYREFNEDLL